MTALIAAAHPLVHVNASLNCLATLLLIIGFVLIRRRNEAAHKCVMLAAFGVSIAFLACYLTYHSIELHTPFTHEGPVRYVYFAILISHILLAITVPFLAIPTIVLGMRTHGNWLPTRIRQLSETDQHEYRHRSRLRHRWLAKITFPIWLYVSITGVVVYVMLYHL
ncbi:MAG: DUF420 domain-containing protein [Aeoliella sp.]